MVQDSKIYRGGYSLTRLSVCLSVCVLLFPVLCCVFFCAVAAAVAIFLRCVCVLLLFPVL